MTQGSDLNCPIIGFELTGDPLLEGEFLPLRRGLSVLYGLNGTGKTRLLRGIRAALTGVRDDVELGMIVRAEPSASNRRWTGWDSAPRPFLVALAQSMLFSASQMGASDDGAAPHERELTLSEASSIVDDFVRRLACDEDPELTSELLSSRLFLLMPTGTHAHPAWDAWAVADLSLPAAARVDAFLAELEREYEENSPEEDDAADDWWDQ